MLVCTHCGQENPDGFRFCGACGAALAEEPVRRELRKTVTVVFSDLKGSTAIGEQLDPEAIRQVMNSYFTEMRTILERHGGTVEKFIGDAVMAAFGIPELHEDDALRAVRAAWEMRAAQERLNGEFEARYGLSLQVRTGVNTGEVVAGDPSAGQAFATGDAVNVAARLEQAAPPGEILIGAETYRLVRDAVEAEPVEPLELKGKAERVPAWRLLAVTDVPAYTRPISGTLFVGRAAELALLEQALARAIEARSCELCTIVGPPGIGKSRLVREFLEAEREQAQVVVGRCLPYGEGITYWPLAEIIRQLAGAEPQAWIEGLLAGEEYAPVIAERIAGAVGVIASAGPAEETAWAFRKLFEALARERPLLLVIDDIHWAEPTLLDLLEYLISFASDASILVLCPARAELLQARPEWAAPRANTTVISLKPLAQAEAEQLLARLPEELRVRIIEAAEGNPLFVEQMLALAAENGAGTGLRVPPTIQALLAARIDRLEPAERSVIERASVEGRVFHRRAVAELLPRSAAASLGTQLMALIRKEFIRPDRALFAGDDGFRFGHILIRDTAYEAIAKQLRAELHERFADWLERAAGERMTEYEEILGYHLEQAYRYREQLGTPDEHTSELARRAAARLASAGGRALQRSDLPATINLLERSSALLAPNDSSRARVLRELGTALGAAGEFERGRALLAEAIELAEVGGDLPTAARARLADAETLLLVELEGADQTALDAAEAAIPICQRASDGDGLAEAWRLLGQVRFWHLEHAEATRALESALAYAERAGNERERAWAIGWLASALMEGDVVASEATRRCERLLEDVDLNRLAQAVVLGPLSHCYAMLKRFDRARECRASSRAIFRDLGGSIYRSASPFFDAIIEMLAGEWEAAERPLRESCTALERLGEKGYLSTMAGVLAQVLYERARYDEADHFTIVSQGTAASDDVYSQMLWRGARAKILARRGAFEEGERLAREAIAHVDHTDALNLHAGAVMDLGEVFRLAGRTEEARSALEEALALYERKGNLASVERASAKLAKL